MNTGIFQSSGEACVTIGNFDGVHLGHQALIKAGMAIAHRQNLDFIILTFAPHPRSVLGEKPHIPLTTRSCRRQMLEKCGARHIIEMSFSRALSALSPEEFVERHLLPMNLGHLVIGYDFSLGHNREGSIDKLRHLAAIHNFEVSRIPPFELAGAPVSSTRLRQCIMAGDVDQAARLLGRYYAVCGTVVHGHARGREIGFPTANLRPDGTLLPANGVYATWAIVDGKKYSAMTNIGNNPTFDGKNLTIETFLLSENPQLYGRKMCIEFVQRLRAEKKFVSPAELVAQIKRDVEQGRNLLREAKEWPQH